MQHCSFLLCYIHVSIILHSNTIWKALYRKKDMVVLSLLVQEVLDKMSSSSPFQAQIFSVILLQTHKHIYAEEYPSLVFRHHSHFTPLILGEVFCGVICKHSRFTASQRKRVREDRKIKASTAGQNEED